MAFLPFISPTNDAPLSPLLVLLASSSFLEVSGPIQVECVPSANTLGSEPCALAKFAHSCGSCTTWFTNISTVAGRDPVPRSFPVSPVPYTVVFKFTIFSIGSVLTGISSPGSSLLQIIARSLPVARVEKSS